MKTRTIFATLAVPATALGLFAQENTVIKTGNDAIFMAQGAVGMIGLSGEPMNYKFFTQEFSFNGRPVTNAPYSADEKTESVQTLADGTRITNTTTTRVYRDSQGRTRREMTVPSIGKDAKPHTIVTITDPAAGTSITLDPESKVGHEMPGMPMIAEAKMKAESEVKARIAEAKTKLGNSMTSSSDVRIVRRSGMGAPPKHDDLGYNLIEGVGANGSKETSVIETGAMGNDRPITITSERWYSTDLQIELKSIHNDPRTGETIHTVTNINRAEPDPSLFQVPADFKMDEGKPGIRINKFEVHQ